MTKSPSKVRCPGCRGLKNIPSIGFLVNETCPQCKGKGEIIVEEKEEPKIIAEAPKIEPPKVEEPKVEVIEEPKEEKDEGFFKKRGRKSKSLV